MRQSLQMLRPTALLGLTTLACATLITVATSEVAATTYANCDQLRVTYPRGVAKDKRSAADLGATVNLSVYLANEKRLDRDKDGIVCESPPGAKSTIASSSERDRQRRNAAQIRLNS